MGKYSLCLRKMQREKRRPNTPAGRNDAYPETPQAKAQSARSYSLRPSTLPNLEAVPRPRLLVRRAKITSAPPTSTFDIASRHCERK